MITGAGSWDAALGAAISVLVSVTPSAVNEDDMLRDDISVSTSILFGTTDDGVDDLGVVAGG